MIIVQLLGGLGNQMFQYAFAKALALHLKTELKLDTFLISDRTPKPDFTYRNYELNIFNIKAKIATTDEIQKIKNTEPILLDRIKAKLFNTQIPYYRHSIIKERGFEFDSNLMKIRNNIYLEGYWQTEKYFKKFKEIIKKEFSFKAELDGINKEIATEIQNKNSVSVHIRRGDYINNLKTNNYHGICSEQYYKKAIELIKNKHGDIKLYFFSDDIEWTKKTFQNINVPVYFIENNKNEKSYIDMQLMSLCNHNIIANSSFSWWAAWLNKNSNKSIIAPNKWFNINLDTKDLIPNSWIQI